MEADQAIDDRINDDDAEVMHQVLLFCWMQPVVIGSCIAQKFKTVIVSVILFLC